MYAKNLMFGPAGVSSDEQLVDYFPRGLVPGGKLLVDILRLDVENVSPMLNVAVPKIFRELGYSLIPVPDINAIPLRRNERNPVHGIIATDLCEEREVSP